MALHLVNFNEALRNFGAPSWRNREDLKAMIAAALTSFSGWRLQLLVSGSDSVLRTPICWKCRLSKLARLSRSSWLLAIGRSGGQPCSECGPACKRLGLTTRFASGGSRWDGTERLEARLCCVLKIWAKSSFSAIFDSTVRITDFEV